MALKRISRSDDYQAESLKLKIQFKADRAVKDKDMLSSLLQETSDDLNESLICFFINSY